MAYVPNGNIKTKISIFERITSLRLADESVRETKVIPRVSLINHTSFPKTEEYLRTQKSHIFLTFDEDKHNFNNEVRFSTRTSLIECISFVRVAEFWLKLDSQNTVIIRNSYKSSLSFYLLGLVRYIQDTTFEQAYNTVKEKVKNLEIPKKLYLSYFENYLSGNEFKTLCIHQIVISTLPRKRVENSKPFGKPFYSLRIVEKPTISTVIHDEHHVICKVDTSIAGDVTLVLNRNNAKLFTLFLNTNSFEEGLYRFSKDDLVLDSGTILDDDFTIDIIFFKTDKKSKVYNLNGKSLLTDKFAGSYDENLLSRLKGEGYSKDDAMIATITANSSTGMSKVLQKLKKKEEVPNSSKETSLDRPYKPNDDITLVDINLIVDIMPEKENIKTKKRTLPPKNIPKTEIANSLTVRPFYWAVIPKSCDSIFNELDDVHTQIDFMKFEDWFCITTDCQQLKVEKQASSVIRDSRRLFLVSLSLKTFEKKQFVLHDKQLADLPLEDLTMTNTIIPTDEEYKMMLSRKKELNDIERKMIAFYPYKKLIRLLIFERRFFENKDNWIIGVENIKSVYDTILQSNNIRLLLKTVLELGNTINTNYGNNRRKASAFKVCSLVLTKNYRGKRNDQSLLKFVAETARSRLKSIKSDLETIESIRNDELNNYKEIMNEYILEYRTCKEWVEELDGELRANMKAFLFYFSEFVRNFSNEYREAVIYSSIIKRKFGEPENKNVKEIIAILYNFLKSVRHEIEA